MATARGHRGSRARGRSRRPSPASPSAAVSASPTRSSARASETILLLPPWAIGHSRFWKAPGAVPRPPLPRRHLRPARQRALRPARQPRRVRPADHRGRRARGARRDRHRRRPRRRALRRRRRRAAARGRASRARPRRAVHVAGAPDHAAACPSGPATPSTRSATTYEGWAKANRHYWARDYRGYLEFFFGRCFPEPHSTKQLEDAVGWGARDDARDARADDARRRTSTARRSTSCSAACAARCSSPQSDEDHLIPPDRSAAFAELTGAELVDVGGRRPLPAGAPPGAAST